jgi:hypothetical protein
LPITFIWNKLGEVEETEKSTGWKGFNVALPFKALYYLVKRSKNIQQPEVPVLCFAVQRHYHTENAVGHIAIRASNRQLGTHERS